MPEKSPECFPSASFRQKGSVFFDRTRTTALVDTKRMMRRCMRDLGILVARLVVSAHFLYELSDKFVRFDHWKEKIAEQAGLGVWSLLLVIALLATGTTLLLFAPLVCSHSRYELDDDDDNSPASGRAVVGGSGTGAGAGSGPDFDDQDALDGGRARCACCLQRLRTSMFVAFVCLATFQVPTSILFEDSIYETFDSLSALGGVLAVAILVLADAETKFLREGVKEYEARNVDGARGLLRGRFSQL